MSNFNNFLKITPAMAAVIGATTEQEFGDKFTSILKSAAANAEATTKLQADFTAANKTIGELQAALVKSDETISAQATEIKNLKAAVGNPATLTEDRITAIAKTAGEIAGEIAGSAKAVEALGQVGGAPATAAPINQPAKAAQAKSFADLISAEIAAGKSKPDAVMAVIKSNPEAHKEWLNAGGKL